MELSYDTAAFARLRQAVRTGATTDGLPLETIAALAELRAAAAVAVSDAGDEPAFQLLCWRVWDELAKVSPGVSALTLPPCYRTSQLEKQINWAASHLRNLECGTRPIGDHAIYSGVKGTGKTTLLLCIGVMAAVLLDRTVPIYWTYERRGWRAAAPIAVAASAAATAATSATATATATTAASAAAAAAGTSTSDEAAVTAVPTLQALLHDAASNMASGAGLPLSAPPVDIITAFEEFVSGAGSPRYPLLLLDEFTELYFVAAAGSELHARLREQGARIMDDLHWLCKSKHKLFCLLAASKTDVEYYMYPERVGAELSGYPNVNNSIFKRRRVDPIRDAAVLARYVAARFNGAAVDGEFVLDATGGVGRDVAVFMANAAARPDMDVSHIVASPDLFALHSALLAAVPPVVQRKACWPTSFGIPCLDAVDIMIRRGWAADAAARQITRWCDSMLFFRDEEGMLEALVPARLREFGQRVAAAAHLRAAQVLAWTLRGFPGGSPGAFSESLICEYIHSLVGVERSSNLTLKLDRGVAVLEADDSAMVAGAPGAGATGGASTAAAGAAAGSAASVPVATPSGVLLKDIERCVLRWRLGGKELGIDRIWLTLLDDSTDATPLVRLDFLQLKSGKDADDSGFTPGVLDTERGRPTGRVSRNTFAGIMVTAERGLSLLLPALHACFPHATWSLGTFWVCCTKPLCRAAEGFARDNPDDSEAFRIRESPEGAIRAGTKGRTVEPLQFEWRVNEGVEWVRRILPANIRTLL